MPNWTEQQLAFIDAARNSSSHLLGEALAGSAKTTTSVEAAQLFSARTLAMAFNKRIADELGTKMPREVECRTFNSLGHRNLYGLIKAKLQRPDPRKWLDIRRALGIESEDFPDFKRALALAKAWALAPATAVASPTSLRPDEPSTYKDLIRNYDIDVGSTDNPVSLLREALRINIQMAFQGKVDFDDQLYLPVIYRSLKPEYGIVMVDEYQDVNPVQQAMFKMLLAPGGRLIGVGDRHQGIYAFRGADPYSIPRMVEEFSPEVRPLTTCFRCSHEVIVDAQRFVPEIEAWDGSPEGSVSHVEELSAGWFRDEARRNPLAVLCRNNAPLVSLAFTLIRAEIPCTILGRDIGQGLVSMVRKTKADKAGEARRKVWAENERKISSGKLDEEQIDLLLDKAACISIFVDKVGESAFVAELIKAIEYLFSDERGRTTLSTIHKSKGFEWPTVVIYKPSLMPSKFAKTAEELQQERNLQYVASTRAQRDLIYWED